MTDIAGLLGADADSLLSHVCKGIPRESVHLPGPDYVDRVVAPSDRSPAVMRSLQQMFSHGRLGGTGYLSILPVDQGATRTLVAAAPGLPASVKAAPVPPLPSLDLADDKGRLAALLAVSGLPMPRTLAVAADVEFAAVDPQRPRWRRSRRRPCGRYGHAVVGPGHPGAGGTAGSHTVRRHRRRLRRPVFS